jgi:rubredoxin
LDVHTVARIAPRVNSDPGAATTAVAALDVRPTPWHVEYVSSERRQNELARTCAWCGRVYAGVEGWQRERRATATPESGSHAICPTCAVDYRTSAEPPPDAG